MEFRQWLETEYPAQLPPMYSNSDYQKTGGRLVGMSPEEYLAMVRPLEVDDASRDNIDDLKRLILAGRKIDPLVIYPSGKEDGRHRAHAAMELGIKTVPVIVWDGQSEKTPNANLQAIKDAFQRGIDRNDPGPLGYHGTSVQTLRAAIQKGHLPVAKGLSGLFGGGDAYKGRTYGLHLVPNPLNPAAKAIQFRNPPPDNPHEDAMQWARHTAARHMHFDRYGLDMDKKSHHDAAKKLHHGEDPRKALRGVKTGRHDPAATAAGVVLAISDKAARDFKTSMGGDGNDINLQTRALPIQYITGIEPQNDAAYDWLDSLAGR